MSNFKAGVLGAKGKVGPTICEAVEATGDLELAAGPDSGDNLDELVTAGVQTIVDFTQPDSVMGNLEFCIKSGINTVVDTMGFTKGHFNRMQYWLDDADDDVNTFITLNFAISAVLTMRMVELAAPYFDSAEVIEMHHPFRKDVPSDTTIHAVEAIVRARKEAGMGGQPDAIERTLGGARGAEVKGIPAHAARMTGSVAHEAVIFGAEGQSLTIEQDSYSRTSSVSGALLGMRKTEDFPRLAVGLELFLGPQWPGVD